MNITGSFEAERSGDESEEGQGSSAVRMMGKRCSV